MNSSARRYIGMVKREIPWPMRQKKQFLHQLSQDAALYCEDNPTATPEALAHQFGEPQEIAADFLENLGGSAAVKTERRNSLIRTAVVLLLAIVIGIVAVRQVYVQNLILDTTYIDSITEFIDEPIEENSPTYYHEEFTSPPVAEEVIP